MKDSDYPAFYIYKDTHDRGIIFHGEYSDLKIADEELWRLCEYEYLNVYLRGGKPGLGDEAWMNTTKIGELEGWEHRGVVDS